MRNEKTYLLRGKTTLFEANYREYGTKDRQDIYHEPIRNESLKEAFDRLKKEKEANKKKVTCAPSCSPCLIL